MIKILGISGSLRKQSYNTALVRAAEALAGPDIDFGVATLHGIPLYDGDLEQEHGTPESVQNLKSRILDHDGILLVTPEYNNGIPGVFKNAIDWLSRPTSGFPDVFQGRPVAVIGASPGGFGTILSQNHWLPVLRTLGTQQWHGGRLMVSHAHTVFADDSALIDENIRTRLSEFLQAFAQHIAVTDKAKA